MLGSTALSARGTLWLRAMQQGGPGKMGVNLVRRGREIFAWSGERRKASPAVADCQLRGSLQADERHKSSMACYRW
jgi:hypothetical protein